MRGVGDPYPGAQCLAALIQPDPDHRPSGVHSARFPSRGRPSADTRAPQVPHLIDSRRIKRFLIVEPAARVMSFWPTTTHLWLAVLRIRSLSFICRPARYPAEVVGRPEDIHPKIAPGTVSLFITHETIHDMGGSELQPARAPEVAMVHSIFTAKSV